MKPIVSILAISLVSLIAACGMQPQDKAAKSTVKNNGEAYDNPCLTPAAHDLNIQNIEGNAGIKEVMICRVNETFNYIGFIEGFAPFSMSLVGLGPTYGGSNINGEHIQIHLIGDHSFYDIYIPSL